MDNDLNNDNSNTPNDDAVGKPPFQLPPPTLEELGIVLPGQHSLAFKVFRTFCLLVMILMIACGGGTYIWLKNLGVFTLEEQLKSNLTNRTTRDNSIVLDRYDQKIGEFFDKYHLYTPFDKIPTPMLQAIIAIEDRNFFKHPGIDIVAILRAARATILDGEYSQGASTITQQVARNLLLSREKTLHRKVKEIAVALQMERLLSKQEILEIYANKLFLGYGSYGIGAAAKRFFNKTVSELDVHECALIAGMFQSPTRYNPHRYPERALKRQRQVLVAMYQAGYLTREQAAEEGKKPLVYSDYNSLNELVAPYFIDYVKEEAERLVGKNVEGRGLRIYTTLDTKLQQAAQLVYEQSSDIFEHADSLVIPDLRKHKRGEKPSVESAMLSIEPTTGEILTMIGGRDYAKSKYNRTWQAKRQPGSAFKPIVYSLALNSGHKWNDMLFVSPVSIGGYRPKNFGGDFLSETTMLRAFYMSMNTATVEIGNKVGLAKVIEYAQELGIRSPLKEEPGTMIGSSELTMMDLARVYSVFANYGRRSEPYAIREIRDSQGQVIFRADPLKLQKQVIPPQIAYLTLQGLKQVMARGTAAKAGHWAGLAAGKTGTSNEAVDNWFAGFTRNLLTIVWVGVDTQLPMSGKATGGELALPLWDRYMTEATKTRKRVAFWRPKGVVRATVDPKYGHVTGDGMSMWFLSNNRPANSDSATAEFKALEEKPTFRSLFMH